MNKYIKKISLFYLLLVQLLTYTQERVDIRIGVKNNVPDVGIEAKIANNNYNFVDSFEYELAKLLADYSKTQNKYNITFHKVDQDKKLNEIKSGNNIDALLFTFSETSRRINDGIIFSIPYFQNKAIGVISKNKNIDVNNIGDNLIRIGYISNTTAARELEKLKLMPKNSENLISVGYSNHNQLLTALKEKNEVDAIVGDVSRLVYDVNDGKLHFAGNLPTKRSKIRDNYCFGISPLKKDILPFFNNFIRQNEKRIISLENKWLSTALEEAYLTYYNKTEKELKLYIYYIIAGFLLLIALLWFFLNKTLKKKDLIISKKEKEYNNLIKTAEDIKIGKIMSKYETKIKDHLTSEEIAMVGIEMFNTATNSITYVGSGGFLSDKTETIRTEWMKSIDNCLKKKDITFERVVDLPDFVNDDLGKWFDKTNNFRPGFLDSKYINKYTKWLLLQYCAINKYDNLEIINSRGAALWGHGIVLIIKDEKEVLIFTTNKNSKSGTVIPMNDLAKGISLVIQDIKEIGKQGLTSNDWEKLFFTGDKKLEGIVKDAKEAKFELDYKFSNGETLLQKIDKVCTEIQKKYSK